MVAAATQQVCLSLGLPVRSVGQLHGSGHLVHCCWLFALCSVGNARRVGDLIRSVTCRLTAGALDTSGGGSGSPKAGSKQMSKGQLLNELHVMRSRMAEEQSRRREAEVEKVTRVTAGRHAALCYAVLCWGHAPAAWLQYTHMHSVKDADVVAIVTAVTSWALCRYVCCSMARQSKSGVTFAVCCAECRAAA